MNKLIASLILLCVSFGANALTCSQTDKESIDSVSATLVSLIASVEAIQPEGTLTFKQVNSIIYLLTACDGGDIGSVSMLEWDAPTLDVAGNEAVVYGYRVYSLAETGEYCPDNKRVYSPIESDDPLINTKLTTYSLDSFPRGSWCFGVTAISLPGFESVAVFLDGPLVLV